MSSDLRLCGVNKRFPEHMRDEGKRAAVVLASLKPRVQTKAMKSYLIEAGELYPAETAEESLLRALLQRD